MPRCQRTFRRLGEGEILSENGGRRWICPFCADAEIYETVHDSDLLEYFAQAQAACFADFGIPADSARPTLLISGLHPECIREPDDRRYDLYVQRDSTPFQLRLQIGHEIFHRTCSQGRIFHWTHEMLACMVSVRFLCSNGFSEYAEQMEREYATQAQFLPLAAMLSADLSMPPYPPGLYGRVFVTGQALEDIVGWPILCRLARCLNNRGLPDIEKWISGFPSDVRLSLQEILRVRN